MVNKPREIKPPTILNIRLQECREKLGLSQRDVAQALNLKDNKLISWYEKTGAMPPYEKLVALKQLYGVSFDYLFGEDIIDNIPNKDKQPLDAITMNMLKKYATSKNSYDKQRLKAIKKLTNNPILLDNIINIMNIK